MKFVAPLSELEQTTLKCMQDHHLCARVRKRAEGILLSHLKFTIQVIAVITGVCRQTVSSWFDGWNKHGLAGLYANPTSGHPPALNEQDVAYVMQLTTEEPRSIEQAICGSEGRSYATLDHAVRASYVCAVSLMHLDAQCSGSSGRR